MNLHVMRRNISRETFDRSLYRVRPSRHLGLLVLSAAGREAESAHETELGCPARDIPGACSRLALLEADRQASTVRPARMVGRDSREHRAGATRADVRRGQ